MKNLFGYVLLPVGLVAVFVGIRAVSGGSHAGWLGIVPGIFFAIASYRLMTPRAVEETPVADEEKG
jgi:hypothetical protein